MTAETTTDLPRLEHRMLRWMVVLGVLGTLGVLLAGRWHASLGFAIGAVLGVLNFHWLWQTGKVLMGVESGRVPLRSTVLIVARYPLTIAALALLYFSGWLPMLPVIAGLLVPGGGVFVESLLLIGASLGRKQTA